MLALLYLLMVNSITVPDLIPDKTTGYLFNLFNKTLNVESSTVQEEYADYAFSFYMDQQFLTGNGYNFYASVNFTDFFQSAKLWLTPEQILCQAGRYLDPLEICNVLILENIVEIGVFQNYPTNRFDVANSSTGPLYQFWSASFVIKNLQNPDFVNPDFPPISVTFYNGAGKGIGAVASSALFYFVPTPAIIIDLGVVFD